MRLDTLYFRQVVLAVADIEETVEHLCSIFDTSVVHADPSVSDFGVQNRVLGIGSQFIELVSPIEQSAPANRFIVRRGEGLYAVLLQCDDDAGYRARADVLRIRRILEMECGDFRCFQMHPSDAGISVILEIDRQPGGPHGRYYPGGNVDLPAEAARTASLRAIHLPSPDASAMASRWSRILDRPVSAVSTPISVVVDNSTLFFPEQVNAVPTLEVAVANPGEVVKKAAERGLASGCDDFLLAGLEFRLVATR